MTPDEINKEHGKPSWLCYGCKAESGLHWWNGLSVAVCSKPECSKAYSEMLSAEVAAQESLDAYTRENYPF